MLPFGGLRHKGVAMRLLRSPCMGFYGGPDLHMSATDHTPAEGRRYRGQDLAARRAERRTRLLDAGLELMATRGYAGTTVEAIYTHARLAPRYFYEEFADREALLRGVYDRIVEQLVAQVAEARAAAAGGDVRTQARAGLEVVMRFFAADERAAWIFYLQVHGVSAQLYWHRVSVVRAFAADIEREARRLADAGELPDRDFQMTAMALVGGTNEIVLDWLSSDPRAPAEAVVDELTEIYVAALSAPR